MQYACSSQKRNFTLNKQHWLNWTLHCFISGFPSIPSYPTSFCPPFSLFLFFLNFSYIHYISIIILNTYLILKIKKTRPKTPLPRDMHRGIELLKSDRGNQVKNKIKKYFCERMISLAFGFIFLLSFICLICIAKLTTTISSVNETCTQLSEWSELSRVHDSGEYLWEGPTLAAWWASSPATRLCTNTRLGGSPPSHSPSRRRV